MSITASNPIRRSLAGLCLALTWSVAANAADPVTNTLTVHHVVVRADGSESLEPAGEARPGDLLEYSARFANTGTAAARGLVATLPIPTGTVYVDGSAKPAGANASLDGANYAPMPLVRRAKAANGTESTVRVPLAEYRSLRWAPADVAAQSTYTVTARVRVAGSASATASATARPTP